MSGFEKLAIGACKSFVCCAHPHATFRLSRSENDRSFFFFFW